jgi:GNAT superfamily N-acetyltransferase
VIVEATAELIRDLDRADEAFFVDMTNRTPGARLLRQDGLVLAIGTVPSPTIVNTILPVAPLIEPDAMDRALVPFREVGHGVGIWTRDHLDAGLTAAMLARGYRRVMGLPGMVLRERPAAEAAPEGVDVHAVETDDDLRRWLEANLEGFAEDDGDREAMRSVFSTVQGLTGTTPDGSMAGFYAEAEGTPAGAAMVFVDPVTRVGIVGWVGTHPAFRRRGIGRAVTLAAVLAGFDLGAVTMSLQASPMGLPVYAKMGFETVTGYQIWTPPS